MVKLNLAMILTIKSINISIK